MGTHTCICMDMTLGLEPLCVGIRERGNLQGEDFNCEAEDGMSHDRRLTDEGEELINWHQDSGIH